MSTAALPVAATPIAAHDIPARVTVIAYVRPEGRTLRLLMRVPLEAMRDVNFPWKPQVGRSAGILDVTRTQPLLPDAARLWIAGYIELQEDDRRLPEPRITATRLSLPSDRSFASYETALASMSAAPLPAETEVPWQQVMLDVLMEYPIANERSHFSIRPSLGHLGLRTSTVLRFIPAGRAERVFNYVGNPGLVRLDPRWFHSAATFTRLGFTHILGGIDHLLFVLCLVIPFRRLRPLLAIVTAFTVAHSITLIASALGLAPAALWFPPLIEGLIALSILYMALENIVGPRLDRRWMVAFAFGLVHGFGFSFALRESLQFAGAHLATALVSFNAGVELGQVAVLLVVIPVLDWAFRRVATERIAVIVLSALIAHTAWHWMTERVSALSEYRVEWPALDAAFLAAAMRGAMLLLLAAAAWWLLAGVLARWSRETPRGDATSSRSA